MRLLRLFEVVQQDACLHKIEISRVGFEVTHKCCLGNPTMTDVFISYSRKDQAFVKILNQALTESKYEAWVDWKNIPLTADWWEEIKSGIEAADTFIFVISPDSIGSKVCGQEIDHAVEHNKRLVPIVRQEGFDMEQVRPALRKTNWLFFKDDNDFDAAFQSLVKTLNTDLSHVKTHTRLLVRTLEWEKKQRCDDFLLRGSDLETAEQWLDQEIAEQHKSLPTEQQKTYIVKSREVEDARQRMITAGEQAKRMVRIGAGVLLGTVAVAVAVGVFSIKAYKNLRDARVATETEQLNIQANQVFDSQQIEALLLAMESGQQAKQLEQQNDKLVKNSSWALERILYAIKEKNIFYGHQDHVWDVSYSPDGNHLISASRDGTSILWNARGDVVAQLRGHSGQVYSASFSPDGQLIATASEDKTIKIWDLEANLKHTLNGHTDEVIDISFSPNGKFIASVSRDKTVRIWNLEGQSLLTLQNEQEQATGVHFSPNGKTIAISYRSGIARILNLQGKEILKLKGHEGIASSVKFNLDGQIIGTTSTSDDTARLWNLEGKELNILSGHIGRVRSIDFSPDGKHLATVSDEGIVRLWDIDGNLIDELRGHSDRIDSVVFSPNGQTMATASGDKTVRIWDISGSQLSTFTHHTGVCSLAFFQTQDRFVSLTQDKSLYLWDLNGKEIAQFRENEASRCSPSELALSQNNKLIISTGTNNTAILRNRSGAELSRFADHPGPVYAVGFSDTGNQVFTISTDGKARLWTTKGKDNTVLRGGGRLWKGDFSPDSHFFATASTEGYVKIWTSEGILRKAFRAHDTVITNLQFLPKSEHFLTTSFDRTARLWNLHGEQIRSFEDHDTWIYSADFSIDENYLALGTTDGSVYIWSTEGDLLRSFKAHEESLSSLRFHPKGNILATASTDGTVKMWAIDENLDKLLLRGCNWLEDYLVNNPYILLELEICHTDSLLVQAAPALVSLGEENAKKGNIETAIAQFKQAFTWDPNLLFEPTNRAQKFRLIGEGESLAQAGKFEMALAKFQEAQQIDGAIEFDPIFQARRLSSVALLGEGEIQIESENFEGATAFLLKAKTIDPDLEIPVETWNRLCREGSIQGYAENVLEACEKSVTLAPEEEEVIESRGVARALTGNIEGAINDFQLSIEWTDNDRDRLKRQEWIQSLKAGKNPFTPEVLSGL